nr:septum formation protein Maf [candidate division Zixibacteria bacterium]
MIGKYKNLAHLLDHYCLVLASGSPRRIFLLDEIGITYRQIIPDIHEDNNAHIDPHELATLLALKKAQAILDRMGSDEIALGCDTLVVLEGHILGKPSSPDEAFRMLNRLSGQKHTVCSGVALVDRDGNEESAYELSDVYFRDVSPEAIRNYVATGEPLDKAGSYGIQEQGVFLVDRVIGNIDNVIGLPRDLLDNLAAKMAVKKGLYGIGH